MHYIVIKNGRVVERAESEGLRITASQEWPAMKGKLVTEFIAMCQRNGLQWKVRLMPYTEYDEKVALREEMFR